MGGKGGGMGGGEEGRYVRGGKGGGGEVCGLYGSVGRVLLWPQLRNQGRGSYSLLPTSA